jgi:hypothetical protein
MMHHFVYYANRDCESIHQNIIVHENHERHEQNYFFNPLNLINYIFYAFHVFRGQTTFEAFFTILCNMPYTLSLTLYLFHIKRLLKSFKG